MNQNLRKDLETVLENLRFYENPDNYDIIEWAHGYKASRIEVDQGTIARETMDLLNRILEETK